MFARTAVVLGCALFASAQVGPSQNSVVFQEFTVAQCRDGQYSERDLPATFNDAATVGFLDSVGFRISASNALRLFESALGVRLPHGGDVISRRRQCATSAFNADRRRWRRQFFARRGEAQRRTVIATMGRVVASCARQGGDVLLGRGQTLCSSGSTPASIIAAAEASQDSAVHVAFQELTSNAQDRVFVSLRRVTDMLRDLRGRESSLDACSRRLALSVYARVMLYAGSTIQQYPARGSRGPQQSTLVLDRVAALRDVVDRLRQADGCSF